MRTARERERERGKIKFNFIIFEERKRTRHTGEQEKLKLKMCYLSREVGVMDDLFLLPSSLMLICIMMIIFVSLSFLFSFFFRWLFSVSRPFINDDITPTLLVKCIYLDRL